MNNILTTVPQTEGENGHLFSDSSPSLAEGCPWESSFAGTSTSTSRLALNQKSKAPTVLNKVLWERSSGSQHLVREAVWMGNAHHREAHGWAKSTSPASATAANSLLLSNHHVLLIHLVRSLLDPTVIKYDVLYSSSSLYPIPAIAISHGLWGPLPQPPHCPHHGWVLMKSSSSLTCPTSPTLLVTNSSNSPFPPTACSLPPANSDPSQLWAFPIQNAPPHPSFWDPH